MDNPFLEQSIKDELYRLKDVDENYWRVYGLGLQGTGQDSVFSNFKIIDEVPGKANLISYGLDFGYSIDPTAVVGVYKDEYNIYIDEVMYERGLTNQDVAEKLKSDNRSAIHNDKPLNESSRAQESTEDNDDKMSRMLS